MVFEFVKLYARHIDERYPNWINLDEKWFYVVRIKGFVWILPDYMDEKHVKRLPVQNKKYITKVLYLCAVARHVYMVPRALVLLIFVLL